MRKSCRYAICRIVIFNFILICIFLFIYFDKNRLSGDFTHTMSLLRDARSKAIHYDQLIIVRFKGKKITVENKNQSIMRTLLVPTLYNIKYNTIMGNNMIVFDRYRGTSAYNIRVHGGEINFKSWFGWKKNIHVNCTGLARDGVYPIEEKRPKAR